MSGDPQTKGCYVFHTEEPAPLQQKTYNQVTGMGSKSPGLWLP